MVADFAYASVTSPPPGNESRSKDLGPGVTFGPPAARLRRLSLVPDPRIETGYLDSNGDWVDVPAATLEALHAIFGRGDPSARPAVVVSRGRTDPLEHASTVELEDGATIDHLTQLPEDLPLGYHTIYDEFGSRRLIVGPGKCYLPEGLRVWGWALQLYALWSEKSCGIGDLADLRSFGVWARGAGASMVLINPLHAHTPLLPVEPSPYYPSSRCFRDPLYLRVENIAADVREEITGRGQVDRDAVFKLKMDALEATWAGSHGDAGFDAYTEQLGDPLWGFATFCAIAERHGGRWDGWPQDLQRPDSPAVERFRSDNHDRVRFHAWLQWLLDEQLAAAEQEIGIVNDLAIGVDPHGADAWWWQDSFATGASIGAPPDDYALDGQDWGVLGFDHFALSVDYEPFIQMVRSNLRNSSGMRFDHVMGLFRLFFIPEGMSPKEGAYVRYPAEALLEILALESHRAQGYVIGEDLGTVEPQVRAEMTARDMLSYKLLWFFDDLQELQRLAMAAPNTHDLPTTAALWSGSDLEEQRKAGLEPNVEFAERIKERICRHLGLSRDATIGEVVDRSCELLAASDCAVVTVGPEDSARGDRQVQPTGHARSVELERNTSHFDR